MDDNTGFTEYPSVVEFESSPITCDDGTKWKIRVVARGITDEITMDRALAQVREGRKQMGMGPEVESTLEVKRVS